MSMSMSMTTAPVIDLEVKVKYTRDNGGNRLHFTLTGNIPQCQYRSKELPSVGLQQPPGSFSDKILNAVDQRKQNSLGDPENLAVPARQLYEQLLPEELRNLLWSCRNENLSLLIESTETYIPWSLLKLWSEHNGQYVEGPYLCEAFALSQWTTDQALRTDIKLQPMLFTAGDLEGMTNVNHEFHSINQILGPITAVQPGREALKKALAAGKYASWHFIGHGHTHAPSMGDVYLKLQNGEVIGPEQISGEVMNMRQSAPVVILNCCYAGRGGLFISEYGGWSRALLKAGAAVFIGSKWAISNQSAIQFAEIFYQRLNAGTPLAEAMRQTRQILKQTDQADWLAYSLYGHPLARVTQPELPVSQETPNDLEALWQEACQKQTGNKWLEVLSLMAVVKEPVSPDLLAHLAALDTDPSSYLKHWVGCLETTSDGRLWLKKPYADFVKSRNGANGIDLEAANLRITSVLHQQLQRINI